MKRNWILLGISTLLVGSHTVRGQSVGPSTLNAAGGSGTAGGNEFTWSVGEMTMVSTFTSPSIVVTQGVLQPKEGTSGIAGTAMLTRLDVFPNPSSSIVNLEFHSVKDGALVYRLMDIAGKVLLQQSAAVKQGFNTRQLDLSPFACATYMLQVSFTAQEGATESTSYKLQKLQ